MIKMAYNENRKQRHKWFGKNIIIKSLYEFYNIRYHGFREFSYKELREICKKCHWNRFEIDGYITAIEIKEKIEEKKRRMGL